MKKNIIFRGCATALITPFRDEGIDYTALAALIDIQISAGIDCIVIGGTTGEASTLGDSERYELFAFAKERTDGRCKLMLGTGSNDTKKAMRYTAAASSIGADGALVVTPYYNKGTKDGIVSHYLKIAEASDIPIMLYNVPSRTGVNLSLEAVARLAECERIVGIKEASDSQDRLTALSAFGDSLYLYSGNDSQVYSTLALGGLGVISVASNIIPELMRELTSEYFLGRHGAALRLQKALLPFINALFAETNPAPIKYIMSKCGLCSDEIRLPLSMPKGDTALLIEREYYALPGRRE